MRIKEPRGVLKMRIVGGYFLIGAKRYPIDFSEVSGVRFQVLA